MEQPKSKADLVGINTIPVTLTYFWGQIKFVCKFALDADDQAARATFYGQPEAAQRDGLHVYYTDFLARVVIERPEGLPGFDGYFTDGPLLADQAPDQGDGQAQPKKTAQPFSIADAIRDYFGTAEPMLKKIAEDAVERYNVMSQPAEFFRQV